MGASRFFVLPAAVVLGSIYLASAGRVGFYNDKPRVEKRATPFFARADLAFNLLHSESEFISNRESSVKELSKMNQRHTKFGKATKPKAKTSEKGKTPMKEIKAREVQKTEHVKTKKSMRPMKHKKTEHAREPKKVKKTKKRAKMLKIFKKHKAQRHRRTEFKKYRNQRRYQFQKKIKINGKRLPTTCYCIVEPRGHGKCYHYTDKNSGYCKSRCCDRRWICVGYKKTGNICMLRKGTSRIVPYDAYTCATERVNSYMYVPYAY